MPWGTFTPTHILTLVAAVLMVVALYFILKNRSEKTQTIVLFVLSLSGIAAIIYNLLAWNSPLQYLPFHMCSINAMLLPFAVLTKNKTLCNLLLLWCIGAGMALVVNMDTAEAELFDWVFNFYYFPHVLELGIPILIFTLGLSKLDYKCLPSTLIITLGIYTVVHFINLGINDYCITNNILDWKGDIIQVNYMFSITPSNPLLQILYNILPYQYWYMLLIIVLIAIYLGIVYGLNHLYRKRKQKLQTN